MASGKKTFFSLFLGFAFCVLCGGVLHSQDDNTPYWRHALGGAVIGHPVAQVESVVAATDGGNLKSFSKDGNALWDYFAGGRLTPHVARSREGTSYICRTNGLLIAVNRSGRELWRIKLKSPLTSPVLIGWDGRLFVFTERNVTCMTAAGYTLWSRPLEGNLALAPVRDVSGGVILVMESGEVLRLDAFGNGVSYAAGGSTAGIVAAASLEISEYGPSILLLFADRHLELLSFPQGEEVSLRAESLKGKLDLPAVPVAAIGVSAASIFADGTNASGVQTAAGVNVVDSTTGEIDSAAINTKDKVAVLLQDGRMLLLSLEEKTILWTGAGHISPGELSSGVTAADRVKLIFDERGVYILTQSGATGFAPDGRRLWTTRLTGAAAVPSFGDDGILYSGGADWILYAYRLEDRVRAKQRLIYGEAPEGTYGAGNPGPSSHADYHFRFEETALQARLTEIRGAIKAGAVGANEKEYAAWLMETAGSVLADPWSGNHPPVHTIHRVEAAQLLSFIGSRETIPFLADLFVRDSEPLVKAAAAFAIGKIGVDPEGFAMRAFENAVLPPSPLTDEKVLVPLAVATGALCRFSGPPLSDAGVRLLTILSGHTSSQAVSAQAQRELRSLNQQPRK